MRTISFNENIMPDGSQNAADVNPIWYWPGFEPSFSTLTKTTAAPRTGNALRVTRTANNPATPFVIASSAPYFPPFRPHNQSFPYNGPPLTIGWSFWLRTDGASSITVRVVKQDFTENIVTLTNATTWTEVVFPPSALSTFGMPIKDYLHMFIQMSGGGIGSWTEITDITATQANQGISAKERSCWNCDKFEPYDPAVLRGGVCRAAPPRRKNDNGCSTFYENPIYGPQPCPAGLKGDASFYWCSNWKRSAQPVPPLPPQNPIP